MWSYIDLSCSYGEKRGLRVALPQDCCKSIGPRPRCLEDRSEEFRRVSMPTRWEPRTSSSAAQPLCLFHCAITVALSM